MELSANGRRSVNSARQFAPQNLVQKGEVSVSFLLHYFLAPFKHFLSKELSQIFAPTPGGGYAASRAVLFMPLVPFIWRFTTPSSSQIASLDL
jgi:hypothetical protein